MIPAVTRERLQNREDLWASKLGGTFSEGDPQNTQFFVSGRVDVKQLGTHLRVSFSAVRLVVRGDKKKKRSKKKGEGDEEDESSEEDKDDSSSGSDSETDKGQQANKLVQIPRLAIFLTSKKPKKRMVDAHKSGTRLRIAGLSDGVFGKVDQDENYDTPLVDVVDVYSYQGIVVVKLPADDPPTEEPIVYGYVRLQSSRAMKFRSIDALHLAELSDMLVKLSNRQSILKDSMTLGPNSKKILKPLHVYRQQCAKAWASFGKGPEELVDFHETVRLLDAMDIFMLDIQARRIFDAVDLRKSGRIGLSDLENVLIARELLTYLSKVILPLDIYDTLKADPVDQSKILAAAIPNTTEYKTYSAKKNWGLDYSSFIEAVQILGYEPDQELEDPNEPIKDAFLFGAGIKVKDVDAKYMTVAEFRKGWLQIADVSKEMAKRGLKVEGGLFAEGRNRERVSQFINETESNYMKILGQIAEFITTLKADHRRKRDEQRRQRIAHREKLLHEANKFMAERSQEKRLQLKREQEEKSKKRLEDKVLRNKLLLRQEENAAMKRQEISDKNNEQTRLKQKEIREKGLDYLDVSVKDIREIPKNLYDNNDAHMRLSYVVFCDLSHNVLDSLPEERFFYWMSELRKLKLSQNRLKRLPEEIGDLGKLESLEIDSNRLSELPNAAFKLLRSLQRLVVSNNQLTHLPLDIGQCTRLKYLVIHSNMITSFPASLGDCFELEFIDGSRNLIRELPEDMENMVSLTHLDLAGNNIGHLPHNIGGCNKLQYLDISTNLLVALPQSFSKLSKLEYCNMENNQIAQASHCFGEVEELKYLNLRKNQIRAFTKDFGCLKSLTKIDVSQNLLESLPLEIGMLANLENLKIDGNRLKTLPPELGSCRVLQYLNVSHNAVEGCLPETLSLSRAIIDLDISFNQVDELPLSIVAFRELISFNAAHCKLQSFPPTILTLDNIEVINVQNNNFTVFPIELHSMKKLRKLNMSNNFITLLPRNINSMIKLEELDLSRNKLQALPVEFTEVLECVPNVDLSNNPWDLLPPKWGHRRDGNQTTDEPRGYSLTDALNFLYNTRIFYDCAEGVWRDFGAFYFTNRIGFDDFVQEIKSRIPNTWHEGLVEYAKHVFFISKRTGVFIRWYSLSPEQQLDYENKLHRADEIREENIFKSREDQKLRERMSRRVYQKDIERRTRQAADLIAEHSKNEIYIDALRLKGLHENVVRSEMNAIQRKHKVEAIDEDLRQKELMRLYGMIDADKKMMDGIKKVEKKREKEREAKEKQLQQTPIIAKSMSKRM